MKFILFIALIGAVLWWAFGRQRPAASSRAGNKAPRVEAMVRCAHCGVHLPRSEAVGEGAALFCSESHRAQGSRS